MGIVCQFPAKGRVINGQFFAQPKTRAEYLTVCKKLLSVPHYENLLMSILDQEYYTQADYSIQIVVNAYYNFEY